VDYGGSREMKGFQCSFGGCDSSHIESVPVFGYEAVIYACES
jgi:hypothetical protein